MDRGTPALLALVALALLATSVPMEWFTLHDAALTLSGPAFELGDVSFMPANATLVATGLNGSLTILVDVPIWVVVVLGALGVLVVAADRLGLARVSRVVPALLIAVSAVHVVAAMLVGALGEGASLGAGSFVAAGGLIASMWLFGRGSQERAAATGGPV